MTALTKRGEKLAKATRTAELNAARSRLMKLSTLIVVLFQMTRSFAAVFCRLLVTSMTADWPSQRRRLLDCNMPSRCQIRLPWLTLQTMTAASVLVVTACGFGSESPVLGSARPRTKSQGGSEWCATYSQIYALFVISTHCIVPGYAGKRKS